MHASTDLDELKRAIEELGHTVTNIWNLKQRLTKKPLPIFFIELKQSSNNKTIYETKYLLQSKIIFEPPREIRDIPQCANYQRYGHTKHFCHRSPRCVKCAGDHTTKTCHMKERSNHVKCVLCNGNHPANYKGCMIYKELQRAKYPALRQRISTSERDETYPTPKHHEDQRTTFSKTTNQTSTYTEVAATKKKTVPLKDNTNLQIQKDINASPKDILHDFKELLQVALKQMNAITTLIVNLMTKISHSLN